MATDLHNRMRLFTRVVEAGSFTGAAQQLGVAPTSVSRQVAALEDDLGARLLNRTTRTQRLTDAGALYYERAKRILADIDDANLEVSRFENTPRGNLRITAPITLGRLHLMPLIPKFLKRFPEIEIELALTDSIVDLVENGFDLAVRLGELRDSNLIARRLAASPRIIIGSPAYLAKAKPPRKPDVLCQHNCLTFEPRHLFNHWTLTGPDGRHSVRVSGNFTANNADALRDAALSDLGLIRVPAWVVERDIKEKRLREVLKSYGDSTGGPPIHIVYIPNRLVSPKIRTFIDFTVQQFGDWPS